MGQAAPQDDSSIIVSLSERKLRAALGDAASSNRPSTAVIVELSNVRRRYDSLMEHAAAAAPGASLGQQLYVTRIHAKLSAEEVANGAGLPTHLPDELEAGGTPSDDDAAKITSTIAALGGVPGTDHLQYHDAEAEQHQESERHDHRDAPHVNGHEEHFAEENAG